MNCDVRVAVHVVGILNSSFLHRNLNLSLTQGMVSYITFLFNKIAYSLPERRSTISV